MRMPVDEIERECRSPSNICKRQESTENTKQAFKINGGGRIGSHLQCALAVVAPEAGLVVDPVVGGELFDQVHRLGARRALGRRPLERHRSSSCPTSVETARTNRGYLTLLLLLLLLRAAGVDGYGIAERPQPPTGPAQGRRRMGGGGAARRKGRKKKEEVRCRESRRNKQMAEGE